MSYHTFPDHFASRRFAITYCGRIAAANYHGARIARLLATKMGMQPADVLPLMARPLAREAARALGLSASRALVEFVESTEFSGGRHHED